MSTINIKVVSIEPGIKESKGKRYEKVNVIYREEGKQGISARDILDFVPVYDTFLNAKPGDTFSVERVKNGDFWNWTAVHRQDGFKEDEVKTQTNKPSYQSAEEREKVQVFIIRQSSLAQAVALYNKRELDQQDVEDVLSIAEQFENWVTR